MCVNKSKMLNWEHSISICGFAEQSQDLKHPWHLDNLGHFVECLIVVSAKELKCLLGVYNLAVRCAHEYVFIVAHEPKQLAIKKDCKINQVLAETVQ